MSRRKTLALAAWALALALACAGCRGGQGTEIPLPLLGDAEPLVKERIEEAVQAVRQNPDSASAWGRLGEIYDVHRYISQAASCYERAQELEPAQWRWPYFAGLVLRDTDSATAQRHLARAVELQPDHAPAWFYRGLAALQAEDLDAAENHFRRALEADAEMVNATLGLARVALARGDPTAARDLVEQAARSAPDEAAVHDQRAQIYRILGDAARAAEAEAAARSSPVPPSVLGYASLSDPVREEAFLREGVSSKWLLRRSQAASTPAGRGSVAADLRRAVEIDPERIDLRLALARTLMRDGRLAEARREVESALDVDAERAEIHAELGGLLVRSGQTGEAVRAFRRALEIDPDRHGTRAALGGLLVESGAVEEGIELLRAAGRGAPDNADVRHNLAAGLVRAGRVDEALPVIEELVQQRPRYAPGLTLLGTVQALRGELGESVASLERSLEIDPDDAATRMELGRSLWELGRHAEAIEAFERAARDDPGDPEMATELAWVLATSPVRETRDGPRALSIARAICEASAFGNPMHLDVLAAAQAEAGDFVTAEQTGGRALQIVEQTLAGLAPADTSREVLEEFAGELRERLALYRRGAPYRQESPAKAR